MKASLTKKRKSGVLLRDAGAKKRYQRKKGGGIFLLPFQHKPVLMGIVLLIIMTICSLQYMQSQHKITASSNITSNTIVMLFAGSPITAGQIDAVGLSRATNLVHLNMYYVNSLQERLIADDAFYTLFDKIEVKKQLAKRNLSNIDGLMKQVTPMQSVDVV